jgi:predicted DNA-binding transcriptional regulator AlpA
MRLLTTEDLIERRIGPRSRSQRLEWIREGRFPAPHRLGNRVVWPAETIEAWLKAELAKPAVPFRVPPGRPKKAA